MQSYKPQLNQKFKYNTMITQSNCIENILNYRNNHLSSKLKDQSIFSKSIVVKTWYSLSWKVEMSHLAQLFPDNKKQISHLITTTTSHVNVDKKVQSSFMLKGTNQF